MIKEKILCLFIVLSIFVVNIENIQAKPGLDININDQQADEQATVKLIASEDTNPFFTRGVESPTVPTTSFKPFHSDQVQENEIYLKIVNEGRMLEGYTLKFQVYEDRTRIFTRTIDISDIPASSTRSLSLAMDLKKPQKSEDHSTRKTYISLWDNKGKKVAAYEYSLNLDHLSKSPFLEIILNASTAHLDMNSLQDIGSLAMLKAPQH